MKDSEPFLVYDDALMRRRVLNTCVMIPKSVLCIGYDAEDAL